MRVMAWFPCRNWVLQGRRPSVAVRRWRSDSRSFVSPHRALCEHGSGGTHI